MPPGGGTVEVFVTRLHARYTAESFPADIRLQETADKTNFQGRYVMRHPWRGDANCKQAGKYYQSLPQRFGKEAETLAKLTGWPMDEIRSQMEKNGQSFDIEEN